MHPWAPRNLFGCGVLPHWEHVGITSVSIDRGLIKITVQPYDGMLLLPTNRALLCVQMWTPLRPGIHLSSPPRIPLFGVTGTSMLLTPKDGHFCASAGVQDLCVCRTLCPGPQPPAPTLALCPPSAATRGQQRAPESGLVPALPHRALWGSHVPQGESPSRP